MQKYRIELTKSAQKELGKLPNHIRSNIFQTIENLEHDPTPKNAKKLSGFDELFRIRVGVYRIVYSVNKNVVTIIILKISHRKDAYNFLKRL